VLAQAREEMRQKHFGEAVEILEAGQIKYPDLSEIGDLLTLARREEELLVRKDGIAAVSTQARALLTQHAFSDALSLLQRALASTLDPSLEQLLRSAQAQAAEFDASLDTLKNETMARLEAGHYAEALNELRSRSDKFSSSSSFRELLQRVEERVREDQETSQHVARVLDEASVYLRGGALQKAEAALTACWARAPQDPSVIAFSSQLMTAKAAAEKEREIPPPVEPEVPVRPEQEKNVLAETVRFTPAAAVADLTPPAGSSNPPEVADFRGSPAAVSRTATADEKHPVPPHNEPALVPTTLDRLREQLTWKRLLAAAAAVGLILILIALSARHFRPKVSPAPPAPKMAMHISTVPKGAKIMVDHEQRGTSEIHIDLPLGGHQLQASMPGYKDAKIALSLKQGSASDAVLTLDPLPPQSWIASPDLENAEVWLDGTLFGKVEVGSLQLPDLSAGRHTVKIAAAPKIGPDVVLSVDSTPGVLPKIVPQLGTHQLEVVVIRSNGAVITIKGSIIPANVTLDGNAVGQLTANGLDIKNVKPGVHEFAFEQKKAVQKISLTIEPSPTIYAVVFSPQNVGSVLVETGENNARVYVDGHLTSKGTVDGQLRIPNLSIGKHGIRVVKDGFSDSPPQTVHVVSAQETKLKFVLVPKTAPGPPTATLAISNAPQGGDVFLDKSSIGTVSADGSFSYDHVLTGYHTIEIRKEGYQPLSVSRNFLVGAPVTINGSETALLTGILEITFAFPSRVTMSREGDKSPVYVTSGAPLNLQPGTYAITTSAGGTLTPHSVRVVAGEKQSITLSLH
jgi:PEGA domain